MRISIDGKPVFLHPEIEIMVVGLIDRQHEIHQQGMGMVSFDYRGEEVEYGLSLKRIRQRLRRAVIVLEKNHA